MSIIISIIISIIMSMSMIMLIFIFNKFAILMISMINLVIFVIWKMMAEIIHVNLMA